jgi:ribosomal protein L44E
VPEHYTENTEGAPRWCNECGRFTIHKVSHKRIGRCTEHESQAFTKAQLKRKEQAERESNNPGLFGSER